MSDFLNNDEQNIPYNGEKDKISWDNYEEQDKTAQPSGDNKPLENFAENTADSNPSNTDDFAAHNGIPDNGDFTDSYGAADVNDPFRRQPVQGQAPNRDMNQQSFQNPNYNAQNQSYNTANIPGYGYNPASNQYMPPQNTFAGGQQPVFYNGQYYYPNLNMQAQPKKKMSKGVLALIIIIFSLLGILLIGFFAYCMYSFPATSKDYDYNDYFDEFGAGSSAPDLHDDNTADLSDPNGPSITLEEVPADSPGSTQKAYDVLASSVVSVSTYQDNINDVGSSEPVLSGQGTGIIISENGYIVTNSHVIGDSKKNIISVTLTSGEEYEAQVVGFDSRTDIAVLKIAAEKLKAASFANSEKLSIGQDVVALGNPGGSEYSNSLTRGIVSAVDRIVGDSTVLYIQTDAAINPGNSGGPLANLYGQVIGITTIKVVDTQYEGMGFAIPSVTIKEIADDLIKQGYVSDRVRIGVTGYAISEVAAKSYQVQPGILIESIADDSPLRSTKVREEDIITAINDVEVCSFPEFYKELEKYSPGDEITLSIYRVMQVADDQTFEVKIKVVADNGESQS